MCAIFPLLKVLAKSPSTIYFPIIKQFHKAPHRTLSPQWVAVQLLNNLAEYSFNVFSDPYFQKFLWYNQARCCTENKSLINLSQKGAFSQKPKSFFLHQMLLCAQQDKGCVDWCSAGVRIFGVQMPSNELIICPVTNSIMYFTRQQQSPWERSNTLVGRW